MFDLRMDLDTYQPQTMASLCLMLFQPTGNYLEYQSLPLLFHRRPPELYCFHL